MSRFTVQGLQWQFLNFSWHSSIRGSLLLTVRLMQVFTSLYTCLFERQFWVFLSEIMKGSCNAMLCGSFTHLIPPSGSQNKYGADLVPHGGLFFTFTTSAFAISIAFSSTILLKQLLGSGSSSSCITGARLKYFKIDIGVFQYQCNQNFCYMRLFKLLKFGWGKFGEFMIICQICQRFPPPKFPSVRHVANYGFMYQLNYISNQLYQLVTSCCVYGIQKASIQRFYRHKLKFC